MLAYYENIRIVQWFRYFTFTRLSRLRTLPDNNKIKPAYYHILYLMDQLQPIFVDKRPNIITSIKKERKKRKERNTQH